MQEFQEALNYLNQNKGYIAVGSILLPVLALSLRRLYLVVDAIKVQDATNWGIQLEDLLKKMPDETRAGLSPVLGHLEKCFDEHGDTYRHADALRQVRQHLNL